MDFIAPVILFIFSYVYYLIFFLTYMAFLALPFLTVWSMWRMFRKADEEGWKIFIPFYNLYMIFRIAGRNGWGFFLLLIPVINIIAAIVVAIDLAKHFGKNTLFGLFGLALLPTVGVLILGLSDAEYVGPKHA